MTTHAFGIDIGGSGIKGAPVNLTDGSFTAPRLRIPTPSPSKPKAVAKVVQELITNFELPENCPIGITLPAPILHGVVPFVANLHQSWVDTDVNAIFSDTLQRPVFCVNDADAAGYAETVYGAARDVKGTVIVTTLGTGIGSALICNGQIVPNCELGHLEVDGKNAESQASAAVREREGITFKKWAPRLQRYYETLEMLFSPDMLIVGGGVSRKHEKFLPLLSLHTPILPAELRNSAGIVGAAHLAFTTAGGSVEVTGYAGDSSGDEDQGHAEVTAPDEEE